MNIAITILVLELPDWNLSFIVETGASGIGLEAVLSQKGHLIAFFTQKLSPRAQTKSVYERELMAVVLSVQKWTREEIHNPIISESAEIPSRTERGSTSVPKVANQTPRI